MTPQLGAEWLRFVKREVSSHYVNKIGGFVNGFYLFFGKPTVRNVRH
jgi:hypothetical protein